MPVPAHLPAFWSCSVKVKVNVAKNRKSVSSQVTVTKNRK
jgi:hypothetical protein